MTTFLLQQEEEQAFLYQVIHGLLDGFYHLLTLKSNKNLNHLEK